MRFFGLLTATLFATLPAWGQVQLSSARAATPPVVDAGALTDAQVASLVRLREEEKLARDVYRVLGDRWDLQVFRNITRAEQRHMERVGDLLATYGIADPIASDATGVFTSPEMQALYAQLVTQGHGSAADALAVGAAIEELDIADLQVAQAAGTPADVAWVYANLEKGSRNHLRAFVGQLRANGYAYTPSALTAAQVEAIVSTPFERGPAGGRGQRGAMGQGQRGQGQGMGQGRGWGRQGQRGQGQGMGQGNGRGRQGQGMGQGNGRGRQGQGMGCQGQGQGRGMGQGQGRGMGQGAGCDGMGPRW